MKKPKSVKKVLGAVESKAKGALGQGERALFAGLGALAKAEEEGRSLLDLDKGSLIDDLVEEGRKLARRAKGSGHSKFDSVQHSVRKSFSKAREQVSEQYDRVIDQAESGVDTVVESTGIDQVFDRRVAKAVERLGLADRKKIDALNLEIEALQKEIEELKSRELPG